MDRKIIDLASKRQLWSSEEDTPTTDTNKINPERLLMCREFLGLTQPAFAEKLSVSVDEVQSWETGESQPEREQMDALVLLSGSFAPAWFRQPVEFTWPIEQTSLRFHGGTEKRQPVQREQPSGEHDPFGWAKNIPANVGIPTCRKPDKCSGCVVPIWRWYQPDPQQRGEWRCVNCLLHTVIYDKAGPVALTLDQCKASGVYRDEYPWIDGEDEI